MHIEIEEGMNNVEYKANEPINEERNECTEEQKIVTNAMEQTLLKRQERKRK